jgi:hypothetical protein
MTISRLFIVVLLLVACGENKALRPAELLSMDVFTAVMLDVQIAEGIKTQRAAGNRFADSQADDAYAAVFEKHGISKEAFLTTYAWYRENPDQMELVFETVLDSLSKLEAEVKQAFAEEQKEDRYSLDSARSNNEKSIRAKLGAQ